MSSATILNISLTFCMLGNFHVFLSFFFKINFFKKNFQEIPSECQTVWIQTRPRGGAVGGGGGGWWWLRWLIEVSYIMMKYHFVWCIDSDDFEWLVYDKPLLN